MNQHAINCALNKAVDLFDYQNTGCPDTLNASARRVSKALKAVYAQPAHASAQTIAMMGHAHIDVAWTWPLRETKRKCGRSFSNVLGLMDRYPEFVFCQSQPHLYEYTKEKYPALYKRIQQKVREGKWIPTGCAWVEMDCNMPNGESLVRQVLYGTRFFREEFGQETACLWLPDVFGYSAALPQILRRSGIENFLTQKISWNQFTSFPHHSFTWEGIDGSEVLSHFLPANDYNSDAHPSRMIKAAERYAQKDRSDIHACLFGHGDGGGGPTAEMLERIRRCGDLEGVPKLRPMNPAEFFTRLREESTDLPRWVGELYLELHRGTLTSQARNKRNNRKCELLLRDAEFLESVNFAAGESYRATELYDAWKLVLLNQFHDIIPGSSIKEVYEDSDVDYAEVTAAGESVRDLALASYAAQVDTRGEGKPVVVINTLGHPRTDVAVAPVKGLRKNSSYVAINSDGDVSPVQIGHDGVARFVATVESMGHAVYHICRAEIDAPAVAATEWTLENELLRAKFDKSGHLISLLDKAAGRDAIAPGQKANELILFEDKPAQWEAWDVDIFYNDKPLESAKLVSAEVIETGPVRSVLRLTRTISKSTIVQDVILSAGSARLDFATTIHWADEKQVLLKAAFPVNVRSETCRYEIQYGSVERPTHWNTPQDFAKFEVAGHRWADLSETGYGVGLLNDSRYGYDCRDNVMRLSLLRAPKMPDPDCDINRTHETTFSLRPHAGDFTNGVIDDAAALNSPLLAIAADAADGPLDATGCRFAVSAPNVIIDAVKKAEDDDSLIVRLYEAHGSRGRCRFSTSLPATAIIETDLMENEEKPFALRNGAITLNVKPFQIRTLKIKL